MPDAKNHGLVMFVDLSGSMQDNMEGTLEQLINLVLFCKKVQIPFEVYGFGDCSGHNNDTTSKYKNGDIVLDGEFYLRQYVTSELRGRDYKKALDYLFWMKLLHGLGRSRAGLLPDSLRAYRWVGLSRRDQLGSTPLNDSIIAAGGVVKDFQKRTGVQICNVVFLTDGDSNPLSDCLRTLRGLAIGVTSIEQPRHFCWRVWGITAA
jgi:hypothetical protein